MTSVPPSRASASEQPAPSGTDLPQEPGDQAHRDSGEPGTAARPEPGDPQATPGPGAPPAAGRSGTAAAGRRPRGPRRALGPALLFGALGAALALIASGQVWSDAVASFAQGRLPVRADGSEITGLPSALGLVGLAALVAVFAVRRAARVVVSLLLLLCGAGTVAAAAIGANDTSALEEKAAKASGISGSAVDAVHVTAWPYVSVAGGVLLLCAGLLALRFGRGWPSMSGSGRYERSSRKREAAARPVDPERPEDLWKALDRGEDPTG